VGKLPKIIRSFYFILFSLQAYYAKSLLRKHYKEGGNCHNSFLGHSQIHFPFLQKKQKQTNKLHGAILNDTVQLLLPCKCRDRGEEDF